MKKKTKWIIFAALALVAASSYCAYQNNAIGVTRYTYQTDKVASGIKIIHISDLHNKEFGKDSKRLVEIIASEKPDLIVISGDIVQSAECEVALEFASQAVRIAPVYYSTGNHEERLDKDSYAYLLSSLEEIGVHVLENESECVYIGEQGLTIYGHRDGSVIPSDDVYGNNHKLRLMIAHKPQYIEKYADMGADIVFSGHAHGGQVRIPFVGGLIAPDQLFFPKYSEGVHTCGNATMIISRGLGNSIIPLRINNRPEVVVLNIEPKNM